MERFQQLKNGLLNINQWKLDIRRSYQEYEQLTSALETLVSDRGALVSDREALVSDRDAFSRTEPDSPDLRRMSVLETDLLRIQEEYESLPKFNRHGIPQNQVEVFTDNRTTIAEMLIYAFSGMFFLGLFRLFYLYGIPQITTAAGVDSLDDGTFTIVDVTFFLSCFAPLIYVFFRRSIPKCIKRGVSIVELPAVFCLWIGFVGLTLSLDAESEMVIDNGVGGTLLGSACFVFLAFVGFVIVAGLQENKYNAVYTSNFEAVVEQRKAVWNEENSEVLEQRKELNSSKKLASDEIEVIREMKGSLAVFDEGLNKINSYIEQRDSSIEETDSSIEETSSKLSEKLSSILKFEQNIESTWSSIEPMIPKSGLG